MEIIASVDRPIANIYCGSAKATILSPSFEPILEAVPARTPVAEALKLLGPEPPAEPEKLLSPEELDDALEIADIMDGKLPHLQRQDRIGDEEEPVGSRKLSRLTVSKLQISDNECEKDKDE